MSDAHKQFWMPSPQGWNHSRTPINPGDVCYKSTQYKLLKHLSMQIKDDPWQMHQSLATVCKGNSGNCWYKFCPGLKRKNNKLKGPFPIIYWWYQQCSVDKGFPVYFCNTTKTPDRSKKPFFKYIKSSSNDDVCPVAESIAINHPDLASIWPTLIAIEYWPCSYPRKSEFFLCVNQHRVCWRQKLEKSTITQILLRTSLT